MTTYGERLKEAMNFRGAQLSRKIGRGEVAKIAECTPQNIGLIITNANGGDQKLGTESHAAVAAFLKVNADWLLHGVGSMELPSPTNAPSDLSPAAIEMAVLYDMIPASDRLKRATAYNLATTAIMQVLKSGPATDPANPD